MPTPAHWLAHGWARGGYSAASVRYVFSVVDAVPRFVLVLLACAIYGNSVWLIALVAGVAYAPTLGACDRRSTTRRSTAFPRPALVVQRLQPDAA